MKMNQNKLRKGNNRKHPNLKKKIQSIKPKEYKIDPAESVFIIDGQPEAEYGLSNSRKNHLHNFMNQLN
jgi:hypothetical protein